MTQPHRSRPVGSHVPAGKNLVDGALHIGADAFAEGVPFVLETPGSRDAGDPDLALLKALRDGPLGG